MANLEKDGGIKLSLEQVLKMVSAGVYWVDLDGKILGCNDFQAQCFGFTKSQDVIGKYLDEVLSSEEAQKLIDENKVIANQTKIECIQETSDSEKNKHLCYRYPLFNPQGEVVGVMLMSLNSSQDKNFQKRLVKSLKKSQVVIQRMIKLENDNERLLNELSKKIIGSEFIREASFIEKIVNIKDFYENIITMMPGNVYWLDKNNVYLGCNDENAKYSGLKSRHEIVGKTNYDLSWSDEAEYLDSINNKVMKTGAAVVAEETGVTSDGIKTYLTQKKPLLDGEKHVIGVVGISVDITEKKHLEEKLRTAKEAAEAASKAKTEFILNMEHDIRTPLAYIVSFSDILAKNNSLTSEKKKTYAEYINISGKKLLDLIGEILTFTDIEQGHLMSKINLVNLRKIISDIMELEKTALEYKELELITDLPKEIPLFFSDHVRLHRILLNLVSNAIKYTENGYVKIFAKITDIDKDKAKLMVGIEDSGIGIPQNEQENIFDRFTKLIPSNKNKVKGLGLGLWIVKQLVGDLGGEVIVKSELNKGSIFTVVLPIKLAEN